MVSLDNSVRIMTILENTFYSTLNQKPSDPSEHIPQIPLFTN